MKDSIEQKDEIPDKEPLPASLYWDIIIIFFFFLLALGLKLKHHQLFLQVPAFILELIPDFSGLQS